MSELTSPQGWKTASLGNVAHDISYGYTASSTDENVGPRMLRITDIQDNKVNWDAVPYCEIADDKIDKYLLASGDLVFARTGATVGKSFLIKGDIPESVYASYLIRVRCTKENSINYLSYFFNSPAYWSQITDFSAGVGQPNVNGTKLKALQVSIAPLNEQIRIANKLDELLSQVDTIKARVDAIPDILKRFRQSVLAAAVSGRLTEEWRNERGVGDWSEVKLGDVSSFQNGFAFKSGWFTEAGEYQVIKLGNVKNDYLKLEKSPAYLPEDIGKEHLEYKPDANDILITMTATKYKKDYGYTCLVPDGFNLLINQRVGRLVADRELIIPEYLLIFLQSKVFLDQFFQGETGGVNQGNVGSNHIKECLISLPERDEQLKLTQTVQQLFDFSGLIQKRIFDAQSRINNLTQSILAKAFRGELVSQDPSDEPASELLARIQKEREEAAALVKAAKKATKKKAKAK